MAFFTRRSGSTIGLALFFVALCATGLPRITINADTRVFFSTENENRQAHDLFEKRFSGATNLFIVLHTADGDIFTPERLEVLRTLTEDSWKLPYVTRVESVTNAAHLSSDETGIIITEMIEAVGLEDIKATQARVMADDLLVGRLISPDLKTTGINITVQYPVSSTTETSEIIRSAKEMVSLAKASEAGIEAWYGGRVASSYAFSSASKKDLTTLIPFCFVFLIGLLIYLIRSVKAALALFITPALATLSALGIFGWKGVQLNAATAQIPIIIVALGVASLSHLVLSARNYQRKGASPKDATQQAFKSDCFPIALTLSTTAVGFATLMSADAPPFRDVGGIVSVGAVICLGLGLTLLPALLSKITFRQTSSHPFLAIILRFSADTVLARKRTLLCCLPLVALFALTGLSRITIDDIFPHYFDHSFEFRRHAELIQNNLTGLEVVEFDVGSDDESAVYSEAFVSKLQAFEDWLRNRDKVHHVSSILEVYKRLNQHMTDGMPASHVTPKDPELLAQYVLLYEMSLPYGQDINNALTIDKSRTRVTAIMRRASTNEVRELKESADAWLNQTAPTNISGNGTGLSVMFAYLSSLNIRSMIGGTVIALILISVILMGAFRNIRDGVISLVPNLLPGAIAFGFWGYFVGEVGVAVSVVGALTLGIIVDDTVHTMWRYREARRSGKSSADSVRSMFATAGEPILISTIVLLAGFMTLKFSGFHITSSTGALASMIIFIALIADWFLLPPLLMAIDKTKPEKLKSAS